jgi:hypothetical protein
VIGPIKSAKQQSFDFKLKWEGRAGFQFESIEAVRATNENKLPVLTCQ